MNNLKNNSITRKLVKGLPLIAALALCGCAQLPEYIERYNVTVSAGTDASGGGRYAEGKTVTVTAGTAPAGQQFKSWKADGGGVNFANANGAATTFTMPAYDVVVTAEFRPVGFEVTVNSAGIGANGDGYYAAGVTVTIFAGTTPMGQTGQRFTNWMVTSGGVSLDDANNPVTTFIMPAYDVVVTAEFRQEVTITSAGTNADGNGWYAPGVTVSISAGTPPGGQQFKNWTVTNGGVTLANANSSTTTFTMPPDAVAVTAAFVVADGTKGTFIDARDSNTYKTTIIGGKTWMAENLNYATSSGSWLYYYDYYGRLYDWSTAMGGASSSSSSPSGVQGVCPSGWHLPSNQEWQTLLDYVGGYSTAGRKLKSVDGWDYYGTYIHESATAHSRPPPVVEYPPESCRIPQNAPKFAQILEDGFRRRPVGG